MVTDGLFSICFSKFLTYIVIIGVKYDDQHSFYAQREDKYRWVYSGLGFDIRSRKNILGGQGE